MIKSHQATYEMLTKENAKALAESTNATEASKKTIRDTTEQVAKINVEVTKFMSGFQSSSYLNTAAANKVITSLITSLQTKREALTRVRGEIKVENSELNSSNVSNIEQLQKDLVVENAIVDKLAENTEKAKVLSVKLHYTNKCLDDLKSDRIMFWSCILEINQYLQRLLETRDSMLTVSVSQHLSEKRKRVFLVLNQ